MTASMEDLEKGIIEIICELTAIPTEDIKVTDSLSGDLGMDSVTSMELIGMLDERYGIEVEMEETRDIKTVQQVFDLAKKHLND